MHIQRELLTQVYSLNLFKYFNPNYCFLNADLQKNFHFALSFFKLGVKIWHFFISICSSIAFKITLGGSGIDVWISWQCQSDFEEIVIIICFSQIKIFQLVYISWNVFFDRIATDIVDSRLELAKKLGAHIVVDGKSQNLKETGN